MSPVAREWLAVVLFIVCFAVLSAGEALWLKRMQWTNAGKALAFSFATNIIGFCIGLFTSFVIVSIILAMAWDGSLNEVPGRDSTLWSAMVAALLVTPVLLIIIKRLLLWFTRIRTGLSAWIFSLAVSILIFAATLGLPVAVLYFA